MARMHTRRKGQSGSNRPSTLRVPEWMDKEKDAKWVEEKVIELAKTGNTPSMIGLAGEKESKKSAIKFLGYIYETLINEGVNAEELEKNCSLDGEGGNAIVRGVMKKWRKVGLTRVTKFDIEFDEEKRLVRVDLGRHKTEITVPEKQLGIWKQDHKKYTALYLFYESLFAFGQTISVSPYTLMKKYFTHDDQGTITICDGFASSFNNPSSPP